VQLSELESCHQTTFYLADCMAHSFVDPSREYV
jgi:hypothetical protein